MIRKVPGKQLWILKSISSGKELGRYSTLEQAKLREKQTQYFKHLNNKPKKPGWL